MILFYYIGHCLKYMGCLIFFCIIAAFFPPLWLFVPFLLIGCFVAAYKDAVKSANKKKDKEIAVDFERALEEYNKKMSE